MPRRNCAARASAQNIRRHFANQEYVQRNEDDIESESVQHHQRKGLMVAAVAQTVPSTVLDPEITDFCSRLNITPAIQEFPDENESGPELCVSDQSSDVEEESELKKFTQALQIAQITALKKEMVKKRTKYSKKSKQTLKRRAQVRNKLESMGFLPVDKYI
jgi:hypothetical protein